MLITTRPLNCFGQMVPAGHPIPTPEKWNKVALQSNINIGWVREATTEEAEEISRRYSNPEKRKPRASERRARKASKAVDLTKDILRCKSCPDREFSSQRALKVHQARSHRK